MTGLVVDENWEDVEEVGTCGLVPCEEEYSALISLALVSLMCSLCSNAVSRMACVDGGSGVVVSEMNCVGGRCDVAVLVICCVDGESDVLSEMGGFDGSSDAVGWLTATGSPLPKR